MKKEPLVSIVIPCYKQAHYLPDAIESALNQTYPNIEIIVVNDGSPDNTSEVAKKYPKVILLEQENRGLSGARNAGIGIAKGAYILPLDSDDKIHPEMVARTIKLQNDYDIISTGLETFGDENRKWITDLKEPKFRNFLQRNHINCCSLFKRTVWEKTPYDENMKLGFEDWDFWISATRNGFKVRVIPDILFYYRKHGQTMFHDAMKRKDEIIQYMKTKVSSNQKLIDVVYVLGKESKHNNNELKFSLRSLEKHCTGWNNVYVIGETAWWLTGVKHYPHKDIQPKALSILKKIEYACKIPELSERFLFTNDDHFFVKDMDITEMDYQYNNKERENILETRKENDGYRQLIEATNRVTKSANYFDIHKPIIYEKTKFLDMCKKYNFSRYTHGLLIKTMYCYFNKIKGVEGIDYILRDKLGEDEIREKLKDADIFSIHDPAVNKDLINFFESNYPFESKFEIL